MRPLTAQRRIRTDWRPSTKDLRLIASITLLGGALGVAVRFVSLLAATDPWETPEHLAPTLALFLGAAGLVSGVIVAAPLAYFKTNKADYTGNILIWVGLGFVFAITVPLIMGVLSPFAITLFEFVEGHVSFREAFDLAMNHLFRAFFNAFIGGTPAMFTSFYAGIIFAISSWLVDFAHRAPYPSISQYVSPSVAAVLSAFIVWVSQFGPPDTLAKIG